MSKEIHKDLDKVGKPTAALMAFVAGLSVTDPAFKFALIAVGMHQIQPLVSELYQKLIVDPEKRHIKPL